MESKRIAKKAAKKAKKKAAKAAVKKAVKTAARITAKAARDAIVGKSDKFTRSLKAPHPAARPKLTDDKEQNEKLLLEHKKQRNSAKRIRKAQ